MTFYIFFNFDHALVANSYIILLMNFLILLFPQKCLFIVFKKFLPIFVFTGQVQNPFAIKIHPRLKSTRSKSTQPNLRTADQSRVRDMGNSDSKK